MCLLNAKSPRTPPLISLPFPELVSVHLYLKKEETVHLAIANCRLWEVHRCEAERRSLVQSPRILDLAHLQLWLFFNKLQVTRGCAYTVAVHPGVSTATQSQITLGAVHSPVDMWHSVCINKTRLLQIDCL